MSADQRLCFVDIHGECWKPDIRYVHRAKLEAWRKRNRPAGEYLEYLAATLERCRSAERPSHDRPA